ncbi:hypothetical protein DW182_08045 [Bacteroides sp. AM16-24]|uniref:hypothetical protein n=1 Tax=Bacteroides sp. AM16-24 TaxID=2292002 RepID=UPI000E50CAAD|nr:hypothetical protein [Bacteroides sp. AM16-24]RHI09232.1 hypothetical protein DW182_08045 [Bacteroides sp. AM16-24]
MRLIPSVTCSRCTDAKVAHGSDGSGKVRRQSRFGQNLPQTGLSVFSPKTLPLPAIRMKGIRQRKQATDGKSEKRNGLQAQRDFDAPSVSRSFLFCRKSIAAAIMRQTANCAPSRKSCACQPIGGTVAVSKHPFDVGFTIEDFTA